MPNPNCSETSAALRIIEDALDPELVTRALGIEPTRSGIKGISPNNRGRPLPYGYWAISSEGRVDSDELEQHIVALLDLLPDFFQNSVPAGARCEMHCSWHSATGHGGPSISAQTLTRLGIMGIELDFDFYSDV